MTPCKNHGTFFLCQPPCCVKPLKCDSLVLGTLHNKNVNESRVTKTGHSVFSCAAINTEKKDLLLRQSKGCSRVKIPADCIGKNPWSSHIELIGSTWQVIHNRFLSRRMILVWWVGMRKRKILRTSADDQCCLERNNPQSVHQADNCKIPNPTTRSSCGDNSLSLEATSL